MSKYHCDTFITEYFLKSKPSVSLPTTYIDSKASRSNSSLSCLYLNARSLNNKVALLQAYVNLKKPSIIVITETWAKPDFPDGFYTISGYKLIRADRLDKRGGGVMAYVTEDIDSSQISLNFCNEFEQLSFTLKCGNDTCLAFLCLYRPPNITSTGDLQLVELIEAFLKNNYHYNVIVGDFNMPSVDWKLFTGSQKYSCFLNCCTKHYLKQNVRESTRPDSKSILDLIFTTVGTNISSISVDETFGSSDHSILNFVLNIAYPTNVCNNHLSQRNYNKADWNNLRNLLSIVDWEDVFNDHSINNVWPKFKEVLRHAIESSIPIKKRRSWRLKSNPKIRTALRYARRCYAIYNTSKSNETLLKVIHAKEHLQKLIDEQVSSFERHVVNSLQDNPKRYWSYVNSKLANKGNCLNSIKTDHGNIEDPKLIAEKLNEFFYNSFNKKSIDFSSITGNLNNTNKNLLNEVKINFNIVKSIVRSLPNKRSEDADGFSYAIIKGGGDILAYQLSRLFRLSFSTGQIPSDWKKVLSTQLRRKLLLQESKTFDQLT